MDAKEAAVGAAVTFPTALLEANHLKSKERKTKNPHNLAASFPRQQKFTPSSLATYLVLARSISVLWLQRKAAMYNNSSDNLYTAGSAAKDPLGQSSQKAAGWAKKAWEPDLGKEDFLQ